MTEPAGASDVVAWLGGDLDDALAAIGVPAFVLAGDGLIRWQNPTAAALVGDKRGRHFATVLAAESVSPARVHFAKHVVGGSLSATSQLVVCSPDGTRRSVRVQTAPVNNGGRVVGVFGIAEVELELATLPPLDDTLTPRQYQVLVELAGGASTGEIAASLGLAHETVRNHVRRLLRTLQVHSRLEAVVEARRRGLIG